MAEAAVLKVAASSDEKVRTGLSDADRKVIAETLTDLTVQTYRLLLRSQVVHWNVTGPLFQPIHALTQQHYRDLFAAIDQMAERIRALGHVMPTGKATSGLDRALSLGSRMTAHAMIEELAEDHESLARVVREGAAEAEDRQDFVTHDLLTARLAFHEKAVWMLRAIAAN
ncbi:Dps family protein [Methylopila sp. Yamaguchi]|uniref:Dps family protein n=1 Tax=Methylopila sp. Yamaguchi TaxID=1437817 RepID=UPI000CA66FDA|nr:DNA starvation/stationary phase protection protein [Methylopila sp. Yamaguchi]GBD48392.1 ferritin [Methylopila sp. Yamaguchi]